MGAGLNLALVTDVMVVTPVAVLDSGFLRRRIHPGGGHLALLGRAMGRPGAMALGVLAVRLSGTEAARRGLAWSCVEPGELLATARDLVSTAAADPALARRVTTSARLEVGPSAVSCAAADEIERGLQMWSMARERES